MLFAVALSLQGPPAHPARHTGQFVGRRQQRFIFFGATSLQLFGLITLGLLLSMATRRFIEVRRALLAALFLDVFGASSCGA